jgi:aminoglycoside phosphotransferase (APT) family kinase protein
VALKNLIDPELAGPKLERWFAGHHPDWNHVQVADIDIPRANGMSSETVLFDMTWIEDGAPRGQAFVARVAPTAQGLFPTYDLAQEQRVIAAVGASTAVRVPATYGVEEDTSVLGGPFLVMERLSGRVPADDPPFTASGWVTELSVDEQATMYDNALVAMAAISATDVSGLRSGTPGHPGTDGDSLTQQLAHYERLYAWTASGRRHPVLDSALDWVRTNMPAGQAAVGLSWGDARLGNMMFGEDLAVTGVLDWEMATLGEAELDLAWFMFLNRTYTDGMGLPVPAGFPSGEESLARYEELLGRPLVNFAFHEVFAAVRATILMMRIGIMMIEVGFLPEDAAMPVSNPASQRLAAMLELPSPSEQPDWITGHR